LVNDEAKKIIDLPGFGYAKASKQDQNAWAKLILSYLEKRSALTDLILIMDMRHPFQNKDLEFLNLCKSLNLPIHLVLTKADKLNNKESQTALKIVSEKMADYPAIVDSTVFSATKKIGLETLLNKTRLLLEV
jgi:GTP-binding protein